MRLPAVYRRQPDPRGRVNGWRAIVLASALSACDGRAEREALQLRVDSLSAEVAGLRALLMPPAEPDIVSLCRVFLSAYEEIDLALDAHSVTTNARMKADTQLHAMNGVCRHTMGLPIGGP